MMKISSQNNNSSGYRTVKQDGVKNNLIRYLYSKVNLMDFPYKILKTDIDLNDLMKEKYFVSANFSGTNCFLIFFTHNDKYYSFLVDKKNLSYSMEKLNSENIEITSVKLKIDNSIYSGTIFDGIYIKKNKKNKADMFVITDVHLLKGADYTMNVNIKMKLIFEFLKNNYDDSTNNEMLLSVNSLFELNEIETLLDDVKNLEYYVRGLCFYPSKSGRTLIYLYSNSQENKNNTSNNASNNTSNKFNNRTRISSDSSGKNSKNTTPNIVSDKQELLSSDDEIEKKQIFTPSKKNKQFIFEMKAGDSPDIYHLFIVEPEKCSNNKTKLKRRKVDLAYIPNIKKSKWCRDLMNDTEENSVLVECEFNEEKNKWIPIKKSDANRPSYASDFNIIEVDNND